MLRRFLPLLAVFTVALAAGYWLIQPVPSSKTAEFDLPFAASAQSSSSSDMETSGPVITEMLLGSKDAPITVIEYASFTCPHCARFHQEVYKPLKKNYIDTGKVKFVFREVFFDKYGMWASLVARCAGPDKFFGLTDMMLKTQSTWARGENDLAIVGELRKIGRLAGLDKDQLQSCLEDGDKLRALVGWYKENATRDKIKSTPSFMIDGEPYANMSYEEFSKLLDEKLGS
jgi:protein-disulfide isomerase